VLIFFLYLYSIEIPSHPGMNEAVTTVISACFVFTKEKAVLSSMTCRMIVVVTLELRLCVNICIQISMEGTKSAFNFAQQGIHNWPTKVLNYSRSATNPLEFRVAFYPGKYLIAFSAFGVDGSDLTNETVLPVCVNIDTIVSETHNK
jgi:hypothetical protein